MSIQQTIEALKKAHDLLNLCSLFIGQRQGAAHHDPAACREAERNLQKTKIELQKLLIQKLPFLEIDVQF
jgi:hypothetical protein